MKKLFENPEISLFELASEDVMVLSGTKQVGSDLSGNLTAVKLDDTATQWEDAWID